MKKFFLLSGTGRLRRRKYVLYALLIAAAEVLVNHEVVSSGLGLIIELACLVGWIYIISARLHDLGYPGWRAWVWLLLQILPIFGEGFQIITSICGLCLGLTLLFTKGVEEDNEYGPSPYLKEGENAHEEGFEDKEQKVALEEKDTEQKEKKVVKNKAKTAKSKKNK